MEKLAHRSRAVRGAFLLTFKLELEKWKCALPSIHPHKVYIQYAENDQKKNIHTTHTFLIYPSNAIETLQIATVSWWIQK